jgi:hypothetical protein
VEYKYTLSPRVAAAGVSRRAEDRATVFTIAAEVRAEGLPAPLDCTVRDISPGGARLELDRVSARQPAKAVALPEHLTIYLCPTKLEFPGRLAWQDGRHFGVQFIRADDQAGEPESASEPVAGDALTEAAAETEPVDTPADPAHEPVS